MKRFHLASYLAGLALLALASLGLPQLGAARVEAAASQTGSWKPQTVPQVNGRTPILYAAAAYDSRNLWAVGSQGPANVALFPVVLRTSDGGATWGPVYAPTGVCCEMRAIGVETSLRLVALRGNGTGGSVVMASTDGGRTWSDTYSSSSTVPLWGLAATKNGSWAVGTNGRIVRRHPNYDYYTYEITSPTASTLWATTAAPGTKIGWAVGNDGVVVKTTDAGETWTVIANVPGETLTGVAAGSKNVVWIVSRQGTLYKSTNGGESWVRQSTSASSLEGVTAASESVAWIYDAVENGMTYIAGTFDGGANWNTQYVDTSIPAERHLGQIVATSPLEAWAVSTGQILHTTNGGPETVRAALPFVPRNFRDGSVPLPPGRG
jgi:photosystem II stability/assembly factor-like uncharacterized protein